MNFCVDIFLKVEYNRNIKFSKVEQKKIRKEK
nr:MAG TPA: hypothetical protein [Caudoviricetes sp.]